MNIRSSLCILGFSLSLHAQSYGFTSAWMRGFEVEQPEEKSCMAMAIARALAINLPHARREHFRGRAPSYRALYVLAQAASATVRTACAGRGDPSCLEGVGMREALRLAQRYGVPILPRNPDLSYQTYAQACDAIEGSSPLFARFTNVEWLVRDFAAAQADPVDHMLGRLSRGEAAASDPAAWRLILGLDAVVRFDPLSRTFHSRHSFDLRRDPRAPSSSWDFVGWFDTVEYRGAHPLLLAGYDLGQNGESFMVSDPKFSGPGFAERQDVDFWHLGQDLPDAAYVRGFRSAPPGTASLNVYRAACRHPSVRPAFDALDKAIHDRQGQVRTRAPATELPIYPGF